MKDLKPYRINAMLNYNRTQRIVLVEIRPGNMAPNTYTLFSKDKAAMYVFRKEDGEWHQQYGGHSKLINSPLLSKCWKRLIKRFLQNRIK
ncbi:hypothetical protein ACR79M_08310 [Sphingobacterium spiritivorum]|uniref:hypothetical protein n=1 Tax=Sphingobacterium spiritivorum TaxID=258 RepID=UPI003DA66D8A